jgi:L-threonylcarbamoyladenylate synthase
METQVYPILNPPPYDAATLAPPVATLRAGEVVALPTETVYGLAGVATNLAAVARIFEAKERPTFDPLIVHVPSRDWHWFDRLTAGLSEEQRELAEHLTSEFWPGPLTLLLPKNPRQVDDLVTAGSPWVALRSPAHSVFRAVLEELQEPLAAPSANRFGRISPTLAEHVLAELGGRVPLIVDGGPCGWGVESTILRLNANGSGTILRHGPIVQENLERMLPIEQASARRTESGGLDAPGMTESHYAPSKPLRLIRDSVDLPKTGRGRIGYLGWGEESRETYQGLGLVALLCERNGDWYTAAQNLFRLMRELDHGDIDVIYARELPEDGIARAIMDRLRRASAKRPE